MQQYIRYGIIVYGCYALGHLAYLLFDRCGIHWHWLWRLYQWGMMTSSRNDPDNWLWEDATTFFPKADS